MIDRAQLHNNALGNSLLFGLIPPGDPFTFDAVTQSVAEWSAEALACIAQAQALWDANDFSGAKTKAERAKDIADAINNAYGFTIGYWAHRGAFDRADFSVLLNRDDNHNNEWETDTAHIQGVLQVLGYSVTFKEEADLAAAAGGATAADYFAYFQGFDVVWLSNPGFPFDDANTLDALQLAMNDGVGVVLQGDDALLAKNDFGHAQVESISGLLLAGCDANGTSIDNNSGPVYTVTVGFGHAAQAGIAGTVFTYGDDIDTCTANGASIIATATPSCVAPNKPVIAAYEPIAGQRSVTIIMTLEQLDIFGAVGPSFVPNLCDNTILWAAN